MNRRDLTVIDWLLSNREYCGAKEFQDFTDFKQDFHSASQDWTDPIDRAVIGGFISDRLSFSFWAGLQAGIQSLFPELPVDSVVSFCITEESGSHPRDIKTSLGEAGRNEDGDALFKLNGEKKFITSACESDILLVAASAGHGADGKNILRMVSMNSDLPGIEMETMDEIKVTPEFSHCYIRFNDVEIHEKHVSGEDAFTEYMKPFRTVEDIYVLTAVLSCLFSTACRYDWPRGVKEDIIGLLITFFFSFSKISDPSISSRNS